MDSSNSSSTKVRGGCVIVDDRPTQPMRAGQHPPGSGPHHQAVPLLRVGLVYLCCTAERKEWIPIGRAVRGDDPNSEIVLTLRATPLTGLITICWYDGDPNRTMSLKGILE